MDRKTCSVDGCSAPHRAKGLCDNHYRQQRQKAVRQAARKGRLCAFCGSEVPAERRSRNGTETVYCTRRCKELAYRGTEACRAANLRHYYKRRYGLTMEQVEAMRERGCDICGTHDFGGRFEKGHIDHDHVTGRVRGVLCDMCNKGLGMFGDDPSTLRRAADYVAGHVP